MEHAVTEYDQTALVAIGALDAELARLMAKRATALNAWQCEALTYHMHEIAERSLDPAAIERAIKQRLSRYAKRPPG